MHAQLWDLANEVQMTTKHQRQREKTMEPVWPEHPVGPLARATLACGRARAGRRFVAVARAIARLLTLLRRRGLLRRTEWFFGMVHVHGMAHVHGMVQLYGHEPRWHPSTVYKSMRCFSCSRVLTAMCCYSFQSFWEERVVHQADQERFYIDLDNTNGFCGARCVNVFVEGGCLELFDEIWHRAFVGPRDRTFGPIDMANYGDMYGLARDRCQSSVRAIRLFHGVARAIGRLLLCHRRAAERLYSPGGAGYHDAAREFSRATAVATAQGDARSSDAVPSAGGAASFLHGPISVLREAEADASVAVTGAG